MRTIRQTLATQHQPQYVIVAHVRPRRSRFQHPLYWITGLAILEAELVGCWWALYAALNGAAWLVRRWWYIPEPVADAIAGCRPVWPSREAVQRRITEGRPALADQE